MASLFPARVVETPAVVTPVYHNLFYPPPLSVSPSDWTSFDSFTGRTFTQDFCHDQHLTINARVPTTKEGYIKVRQELRFTRDLDVKDQLRLWFPLSIRTNSYIYAHVLDDKVKLHYDHGLVDAGGYTLNVYGSLDFLKNWSNINGRLGASHLGRRVYNNLRVRLDEDKVRMHLLRP